jgi:YegS/Rv2252/BmrU family lipid kinase
MKALLVANPNAGRVRGETALARVEERLRAEGIDVGRVVAARKEEAAEALREALRGQSPERTRVIVAGGDGTINAALPALIGTTFPMAILPLGSVNVLARELGIPLGTDAAIEAAASGRLRRIDLGIANGRPFALMAGMGFDAAVVRSVVPRVKNVVGSLAYVARGLSLLATCSASCFSVRADDKEFEVNAWLAVVANAARYTYSWRLAPAASVHDGWLDLCLFEMNSAAQTAGQVLAALRGRHVGYAGVLHMRARQFHFDCHPPVSLQVDGDRAGMTPAEVSVVPDALVVVVPAEERQPPGT